MWPGLEGIRLAAPGTTSGYGTMQNAPGTHTRRVGFLQLVGRRTPGLRVMAPLELLRFEKSGEVLDDLVGHLFLNVVTALDGLVRDNV